MRTGQWKTGQLAMVEAGAEPCIKAAVTLLALCRETTRLMIRRFCIHEGRRVAGNAVCRKTLELSVGCSLVTCVALDRGMSAKQRKAILVLVDRLD